MTWPLGVVRVQLQARDIAVLRALYEARVMTLDHLSVVCFDGHGEAAKKRVQKLKGAVRAGRMTGLCCFSRSGDLKRSCRVITCAGCLRWNGRGWKSGYALARSPSCMSCQ